MLPAVLCLAHVPGTGMCGENPLLSVTCRKHVISARLPHPCWAQWVWSHHPSAWVSLVPHTPEVASVHEQDSHQNKHNQPYTHPPTHTFKHSFSMHSERHKQPRFVVSSQLSFAVITLKVSFYSSVLLNCYMGTIHHTLSEWMVDG